MNRVVIESPLNGPTPEAVARNLRFLFWCCRAVKLTTGEDPIGSHMLNPWFMDDSDPDERAAGIANAWVWQPDVPHWFFVDLGMSGGMKEAEKRCAFLGIHVEHVLLRGFHAPSLAAFVEGQWPPHTKGFQVVP